MNNLNGIEWYAGVKVLPRSLVLAFLLLTMSAPVLALAETPVVMIKHPGQSQESLTTSVAQRVYAMKKKVWSDGTPVVVYTLPSSSPVHRDFVQTFLKMKPHQLQRLWHRLVFSGKGDKPHLVHTMEEMLQKVEATPGAIGYTDQQLLESSNRSVIAVSSNE